MRKLYLLAAVALLSSPIFAQTNPAAQNLPFSFADQTGATLPAGVAVHRFGTSTATIPTTRTVAPGNGDLINVTTNNSGGWRAEGTNGLSLLASGSQAAGALVVAINTTGKNNVQVAWTVRTMLQQASRDNSIALQYRIGTTGDFINVGTTSTYSSTGKANGDYFSYSEMLPAEANNKSLVQVRWVYWESVSTSGSRDRLSIDDVTIDGASGGDFTAPAVNTLSPANGATGLYPTTKPAITFSEAVEAGTGNIVLTNNTKGTTETFAVGTPGVTISGNTLTLNTSLKAFSNYSIIVAAGVVKDAAGNEFEGLSTWSFTTGEQQLVFDFNDCNGTGLPGGFTQYSATGDIKWACTTFGQTGNAVQMNGFKQANEDWLISPAFDLTYINYPLLSFATRSAFVGPDLKLMVSTNYDGSSNPATATWTEISGRFPEVGSDAWTTSSDINLLNFKGENVYVAIVYTSGAGADEASRWTLDDFKITKSDVAPSPAITFNTTSVDFDYAKVGTASEVSSVKMLAYNLQSDVTLTAPAGFQISADGITFGSTATFTQSAIESIRTNVYLRFTPTTANTDYTGVITVATSSLTNNAVALKGTSLRSLKVVNWNIEWFGTPASGFGPTNKDLQQQNIQTVLQKLNADVYALEEVVDTLRLKNVVDQMPGYAYTISDFGSYTDDVNDPDYTTAQKLAFVYKADVVKNIYAYGVLRNGASAEAYRNWSSGRFPYMMQADVNLEGAQTKINFVVVHAKANTGNTAAQKDAWERRKGGADELKDSLDIYHPYSNILMLGDFNDDLDETIAPNIPNNESSYSQFLADGGDYKPLTLPLSLAGLRSTVSHDNVIDHQVSSNEMGIAYIPNSATVATYVSGWVKNYGTTATDHYPVYAKYDLRFLAKPIEVKNFTGTIEGTTVTFDWTTAHEINSRYFVVERSRNGVDFTAVDSVNGNGDSREAIAYTLAFGKPWPGQTHYRLRTVSLDGTVTYSDVITINMKSNSRTLNAKSVSNTLTVVRYDVEASVKATLQLVDAQGRIYYNNTVEFVKGSNVKNLYTAALPSGVYFVRIQHGTGIETTKVFVGK